MAKFYVAGTFTDNIIVGKSGVEKKAGGPAQFITDVLEELGEEFEVAKGKRGICEIHVRNGEEAGRVVSPHKVSIPSVSAEVVLVSSVSGEVPVDCIKGEFGSIYLDAQGFVRDPANFGGKKNWGMRNVEKVKVLKATPHELQYLPEGLVSHVRKNGVLILGKTGGSFVLSEGGSEETFRITEGPLPYKMGLRDTLFAAFSAEYAKSSDARGAMEFAVGYSRKFLAEKSPEPGE